MRLGLPLLLAAGAGVALIATSKKAPAFPASTTFMVSAGMNLTTTSTGAAPIAIPRGMPLVVEPPDSGYQAGSFTADITGSSVALGTQLAQPLQRSPANLGGTAIAGNDAVSFVGSAPGTATITANWKDPSGALQSAVFDVLVG